MDAVLIIDDEVKIRTLLARIIELEGFTVFQAENAKEGLQILQREDILVTLSDVKLPDANGVELVKQIKAIKPFVEIINLTAYGTIADGVLAIKNGAFDYLTKGDDNEKIIPLLYKAVAKAELQIKLHQLEQKVVNKYGFNKILGDSKSIKEAITLAQKVSKTDTTVLLLGETGTGKEVFAQSIHFESERKHKPFVALNCSGFSPELLESELFGYKAGAFTGANKDKKGLIEEAHQGTLFLDEIGEMSLDLQAKLLRVLENQSFIKIGSTSTNKVDVRIIAATNRKLKQQADEGLFRLDLYYRLSVFEIHLPALRERQKDIEILADFYLSEFSKKVGRKPMKLSDALLQELHKHPWKGNIRELKNTIERLVILSDDDVIQASLLPQEFEVNENAGNVFDLQTIEKIHIQKVLKHTNGNKTETAKLLGIGLTTLYRKMEEYRLN